MDGWIDEWMDDGWTGYETNKISRKGNDVKNNSDIEVEADGGGGVPAPSGEQKGTPSPALGHSLAPSLRLCLPYPSTQALPSVYYSPSAGGFLGPYSDTIPVGTLAQAWALEFSLC